MNFCNEAKTVKAIERAKGAYEFGHKIGTEGSTWRVQQWVKLSNTRQHAVQDREHAHTQVACKNTKNYKPKIYNNKLRKNAKQTKKEVWCDHARRILQHFKAKVLGKSAPKSLILMKRVECDQPRDIRRETLCPVRTRPRRRHVSHAAKKGIHAV
jgi:hypothetical protein